MSNVPLQALAAIPPLSITFYSTCITGLTLSMDLFSSAYKQVHWEKTKENKKQTTSPY